MGRLAFSFLKPAFPIGERGHSDDLGEHMAQGTFVAVAAPRIDGIHGDLRLPQELLGRFDPHVYDLVTDRALGDFAEAVLRRACLYPHRADDVRDGNALDRKSVV